MVVDIQEAHRKLLENTMENSRFVNANDGSIPQHHRYQRKRSASRSRSNSRERKRHQGNNNDQNYRKHFLLGEITIV